MSFKKILSFTLLFITTINIFASEKQTGITRYAIYIGSNYGTKGQEDLLYADSDATSFQKTMSEIGGVSDKNSILLLNPSKNDVTNALSSITQKIQNDNQINHRSEFLFYYSGHSTQEALCLGKTLYDYSSLKTEISNIPSDVHVVILDSCFSGNFMRSKGGLKEKPFLFDDSSIVKGHAYLSSSSSSETSQESDEIEASFFTNAMLTGLRGAADTTGDNKISLNELYSYAFNETLTKTENSINGPQHPNYNITLVGSGDLILSDISNAECTLQIEKEINGRIIIRNSNGKLISEINKEYNAPIILALESGNYSATLITEDSTFQTEFSLKKDSTYILQSNNFSKIDRKITKPRGNQENIQEDNLKDEIPNNQNKEEMIIKPFHFTLFTTNQSQNSPKIQSKVSFGLFSTYDYNFTNLQFSPAYNISDYGKGLQLTSFLNIILNEGKGVQFSGIMNTNFYKYDGVQIAGILNIASDFTGAQFSGITNITTKNINGLQVSGLFNYAKKVYGCQIGLINICDTCDGFMIGLLNFSKSGVCDFSFSYSTLKNLRASFQSGSDKLFFTIGYKSIPKYFFNPISDEDSFFYAFGGLGKKVIINDSYTDYELLYNYISSKNDVYNSYGYPEFRFTSGVNPKDFFGFFFAASIEIQITQWNEKAFQIQNRKLHLNLFKKEVVLYPEFEVGIKFSL